MVAEDSIPISKGLQLPLEAFDVYPRGLVLTQVLSIKIRGNAQY
jgi:hypothetical protein